MKADISAERRKCSKVKSQLTVEAAVYKRVGISVGRKGKW